MIRTVRSVFPLAVVGVLGGGPAASGPGDASVAPPRPAPVEPDTLPFALSYHGERSMLSVNLATVLPGDSIEFAVTGGPTGRYTLSASRGTVRRIDPTRWWWIGPPAGDARLVVSPPASRDSMIVNAFVLVPFSQVRNGRLNGYRIGTYPERPLRGLDIYRRPAGFIEVTAANQNTRVSPHHVLAEFLAKQAGGFPKYVVLDRRLLRKLEFLLRRAREDGYDIESFFVMSGYRTPYYNRTLRNVRYSRHVYGAAADIFIDQRPRDGQMDDLNGDGRVDVQDAQVLIDLVNEQVDDAAYAAFVGGLGRYAPNARRGPFVHIDIRDRAARW